MGGKAQSKTQTTDDSRSSLVENLSEGTIRKELRLDALQHPATLLPLALCILSIIYLVFFSLIIGGATVAIVLLSCSGLTAALSFLWRYSIRYSEAYTKRVKELMALQDEEQRGLEQGELRESREALENGFSNINSAAGLKTMKELVFEYEQLQHAIDRQNETEPLLVARIPALAEDTYRQGLSVLADVLELEHVIHSSDRERLEKEVMELESEIRSLRGDETQAAEVKIKEATVVLHNERLDMIKQQQLRVNKLVYQCDRCEASLHRTRIELAAFRAGSSETSVSAVTETLENTINQAKEVQEELRRLGL